MLSVHSFVTGWAALASRMWYHRSYSNCINSSCFFLQLDPQVFLSLSEEQRFERPLLLKSRCAEIELLCSSCQFALLLYLGVSHPLGSQWFLSWRQVYTPCHWRCSAGHFLWHCGVSKLESHQLCRGVNKIRQAVSNCPAVLCDLLSTWSVRDLGSNLPK